MNVETLLIIDEYFQVARDGLPDLELALAACRKAQTRILMCCVGGMRELMAVHGENFETVLESCGVVQWLSAKGKNAQLLSEMCGDTEIHTHTKTVGTELTGPSGHVSKRGPSVNEGSGQASRRMLLQHEAVALGRHQDQIVFFSDVDGPVRLNKGKSYREIAELRKLAGRNPLYEEKA
jgi:type IV secretory pathway TraG/TraD family ATPase VirD4